MTASTAGPAVPAPFEAGDNVVHTLATWVCSVALVVGLYFSATSGRGPDGTSSDLGQQLNAFVAFATVITSFALVWIGAPLSWLLGWGMRGVPSVIAHAAAFWSLGAMSSAVVLLLIALFLSSAGIPLPLPAILIAAAVCGLCTAIGRLTAFGYRRIRRGNQHAAS